MRRAWSASAEDKLQRLYGKEPLQRLAFLLKRTTKAVKSRAKLLGLRTGRIFKWTPARIQVLRRRYPHEKTERIARDLKVNPDPAIALQKVYAAAKRYGLEKSAKYLASPDACRLRRGDNVGAPYRFAKGHVPANKGLRRPGWFAGRMRETQFKKGQIPHNGRLKIGEHRVDPDGYIWVKVSYNRVGQHNYRALHRMLWRKAHGRIPRGHVVAFRDGNRAHCVLENLQLLTMRENALRNSIWRRYPKELAEVIQLTGVVRRAINKRLGKSERRENARERREAKRKIVRNTRRAERQRKSDGNRARAGSRKGGRGHHKHGEGRGRNDARHWRALRHRVYSAGRAARA